MMAGGFDNSMAAGLNITSCPSTKPLRFWLPPPFWAKRFRFIIKTRKKETNKERQKEDRKKKERKKERKEERKKERKKGRKEERKVCNICMLRERGSEYIYIYIYIYIYSEGEGNQKARGRQIEREI